MKLLLLILVSLAACALSSEVRESCVLEKDGSETCTVGTLLFETSRQAAEPPCARENNECWCIRAVELTNAVRARNGVTTPLNVGSVRQLANAVSYAAELGAIGELVHQDLFAATASIGCSHFVGGENIAFNFDEVDPAGTCVEQWENSSGHLQNILGDVFEDVVVGVFFAPNGRVYCVQTFSYFLDFATVGSVTDPGCETVTDGGSTAVSSQPTTAVPTTTTVATTVAVDTTVSVTVTVAPPTTTLPPTTTSFQIMTVPPLPLR